jgi:RNA polymerase sigma-70 factor (ECF subfamily)
VGLDQIIVNCKKNCPKAQEELYGLFAKKLFGVCLKYSKSYADAQDNLHDGFILILDRINQFSNKGSFEGWAKRVMINNALHKFKDVRFLNIVDTDLAEEDVTIGDEPIALDTLLKMVQQLPDQYRLVFSLYVLDGYSHKEIAEILKITTGTTKSNLARARMILREKINTYTGNPIRTKYNAR